ncbi:MAG: hypothetical protein LBO74_15225 [Candidatus Symbiothrix sp.]|jgi:hypothetical protein|nr:hypothetical protein [Candidatus Symbiothrix sp.]
MKKLRIVYILCFWATSMMAQQDYRPGYIITLSNDTVYGQIDYRNDFTMGRICRFLSEDGTKMQFTPYDITAYRFTDSKYFVSREITGEKHFLEFLIKGRLNVYYLRNGSGDHYYIDNDEKGLMELPYDETIQEKDGKQYLHKSTAHIGILNFFTQDTPQLQTNINHIEKPDHANLIKIAKKYHDAVCDDGESCLVFERKVPLFQLRLEAVAGYYAFLSKDYYQEMKYGLYGVKAYFWMPRTNENFYFKTGVLFLNSPDKEFDYKLKIPIQIEYVYPKGVIRPTLSGGVNMYDYFTFVSGYSIGVLIPGKNRFSFSFNYELETEPVANILPFVPTFHLIGHSLNVGVAYTF